MNIPQGSRVEIRILADAGQVYRAAAYEFARVVDAAVAASGSCTVCLSGGATPRGLYSLLAVDAGLRERIPWGCIHFFWGDERLVPPTHVDSNFHMAQDAMLSIAPVPASHVHRIRGECTDARRAAEEYEEVLRDFFRLADGQLPRFDLVLLGLGADGHIASLFPGTQALREEKRFVVANRMCRSSAERITMTAPALNNADRVIFLVEGETKAAALKAVMEGPYEPDRWPAQLIRPEHGTLLWLADRAAARLLTPQRRRPKPPSR